MTMETYRLTVEEDDSHTGLDIEVRDSDGMIAESTRLDYENYDEEALREDYDPGTWKEEVTADVDRLDVEVESDGRDFTIELLGDDETLTTIHLSQHDLAIGAIGE